MDYTAALRQAHLNALRQKYLDVMEDARLEKEQKQLDYRDKTREAYLEKMTDLRDMPQQLRAAGLGGGVEENELSGILNAYKNRLEELKQEQEQYISEFNRIVEVQTRAMNNATEEYNARNALEDAKAAEKAAAAAAAAAAKQAAAAAKASKSTAKSSSKSSAKSTSGSKNDPYSVVGGPAMIQNGQLVLKPYGPIQGYTTLAHYEPKK